MVEKSATFKLGLVLHFYQPAGQKAFIVTGVAGQSYVPVIDGILAAGKGRVTINLTGALLEQLRDYGQLELLEKFREAGRRGLVEYVASGMYHPILPLLPLDEARRQIELDLKSYHDILGPEFKPRGIFLPEMAWSPELAPIIEELGLEYVLLDELSFEGRIDRVDWRHRYDLGGSQLAVLFRQHRISDTIMSAGARDLSSFKRALAGDNQPGHYLIAASDGETYGHHRGGLQELLFALLNDHDVELVTLSELTETLPSAGPIATVPATWASSEDDLQHGIPFISWNDPDNPIHKLQWELLHLAANETASLPADDPAYTEIRALLDRGESSDQFFWAAGRPFWMIDHIEAGAHLLRRVIELNPRSSEKAKRTAHHLYDEIVGTAFEWQRSEKLDHAAAERNEILRIPFKDRTAGTGGEGEAVYRAFMDLMAAAEKEAASTKNYEAAVMWRDAQYKLEHRTDVYDAFHVVDILRKELGDERVDAAIEAYRADYNRIRGGQSEQRSN